MNCLAWILAAWAASSESSSGFCNSGECETVVQPKCVLQYSQYFHIKVLIILILNNTHNVVDYSFAKHLHKSQNKYDSLTNTAVFTRRQGVCFSFYHCFFLSYSFLNARTYKTLNVNDWFVSLESFISILSIFPKLWIKHISNVISLMPMLYSYLLPPILTNQSCTA